MKAPDRITSMVTADFVAIAQEHGITVDQPEPEWVPAWLLSRLRFMAVFLQMHGLGDEP